MVLWACDCAELAPSFVILRKRIQILCMRGSWTTTFHYLKEVFRLVIKHLGSQEPGKGKVAVSIDKRDGLPKIIPLILRRYISKASPKDRLIIVAILTCLSIFRVFEVKVKPSLKSIVLPFHGKAPTLGNLELNNALQDLFGPSYGAILKLRVAKPLLLQTSSPTSTSSTWGSIIDVMALILNPVVFWNITKLSYSLFRTHAYLYFYLLFLTIVVLLICCPFWYIFSFLRFFFPSVSLFSDFGSLKLSIAKLGVVYDQAGKARIVGISNYWVQCVLKPLHDAIFRILELIEEDGTFDQMKPVKRVLSRNGYKNVKYYSFDLSAATDRLPIILQKDILNILFPSLGTLWASLLVNMDYTYKTSHGKLREVRYSVGQPMGAYSSWPMLALTHHIVVIAAAKRVGVENFRDYGILGDDVFIAHDLVASEYVKLMGELGLSINFNKTLQSTSLVEFAKTWSGPYTNITPIGPGLILNSIRGDLYLSDLFGKLCAMEVFKSFKTQLNAIPRLMLLRKSISRPTNIILIWDILWSSVGPKFFSMIQSSLDVSSLEEQLKWVFSVPKYLEFDMIHILSVSFSRTMRDEARRSLWTGMKELIYFIRKFLYLNIYGTNPVVRLIEFLTRILSPGFWIYFTSIFREFYRCIKMYLKASESCSIVGVDSTAVPSNDSYIYTPIRQSPLYKFTWSYLEKIIEGFDSQNPFLNSIKFEVKTLSEKKKYRDLTRKWRTHFFWVMFDFLEMWNYKLESQKWLRKYGNNRNIERSVFEYLSPLNKPELLKLLRKNPSGKIISDEVNPLKVTTFDTSMEEYNLSYILWSIRIGKPENVNAVEQERNKYKKLAKLANSKSYRIYLHNYRNLYPV